MTMKILPPATLPQYEIDCAMADIRIIANFDHAKYPQYKGHWDGPEWTLVKVTKAIKTKMGKAFYEGELALARREELEGEACWCVYSRNNKVETLIALNKAVEVKASN
jgi:hypothetical protein